MDILGKLLEQDRSQKYFFITAGTVFSGLVVYLFVLNGAIPNQLEQMWIALCTYIAAGYSKLVGKAETVTNKDLNGDGVIGEGSAQVQQVAQVEVTPHDAECDASTYTV